MNRIAQAKLPAVGRLALLGLTAALLSSCSTTTPREDSATANLHSPGQRLAPCPSSPNCISSREGETPPWMLNGSAAAAWPQVVAALGSLARTTIVAEDGYYLHAESRSRLFGFVDDVELAIDEHNGTISFRSASRLGYSDLGVNARRLDALYDELLKRRVVR
jgi:uncharacterized protein (DUF1499 family)